MKTKIIFFGNGPLADFAKPVLEKTCEIVFHARTREDLAKVKEIKAGDTSVMGVLASFGVIIREDVLGLFEPEGILNIHPSLLPDLRGPSPIESAMLRGDTAFSVSVMKLVREMDAGPVYFQETFEMPEMTSKEEIYEKLATAGAEWIAGHIAELPEPKEQTGEPTFSSMLTTDMAKLRPEEKTAVELLNQIRAFAKFPKSRYEFFGVDCIIHAAHVAEEETGLAVKCKDGKYLVIDVLQPAGKKQMDAKAFLNGYRSR